MIIPTRTPNSRGTRMKILWGYPGWGWKMYGLASFEPGKQWFLGYSKNIMLPKKETGELCDEDSMEVEI